MLVKDRMKFGRFNSLLTFLFRSENCSDSKTFSGSGDGTGGQVRRQVSMKPPRQSSLIEDDELVVIDGFAYRSMLQELTSTKTMLFRLKRMLQEVAMIQFSLFLALVISLGIDFSFTLYFILHCDNFYGSESYLDEKSYLN